MSNADDRFERIVADMLTDTAPSRLPSDLISDTERVLDKTRRRPPWFALIKEPPMRYSSSLAVGSPTVRAVAILAATLLITIMVAGAGLAGSRLLAANGPIIVDANGGGDYTTIVEAVAAAPDGSTIEVMPGTYAGQVEITKDITLEGMGEDEADVVLTFDSSGSRASWPRESDGLPDRGVAPYGLFLNETDAIVRNLTVQGPQVAEGIRINGGAPHVERVTVHLEQPFNGPRDALVIELGSAATIHDVDLNGWLGVGPGTATITDSRLSCGSAIYGEGASPELRGNTFSDERDLEDCGYGLSIDDGATPTLVGNDISMDPGGVEISGEGTNPTLRENTIHSSGGPVGASESPREDITFRGITVQEGAAPRLIGNVLDDNATGIFIDGSKPVVEGNSVTGGDVGIEIVNGADPALSGNTVCDNTTNVVADPVTVTSIEEANEICAD